MGMEFEYFLLLMYFQSLSWFLLLRRAASEVATKNLIEETGQTGIGRRLTDDCGGSRQGKRMKSQ